MGRLYKNSKQNLSSAPSLTSCIISFATPDMLPSKASSAGDSSSRAAKATAAAKRLEVSSEQLQLVISNFEGLIATLKSAPAPVVKTFSVQGFPVQPGLQGPKIVCDPVSFAHDLACALDRSLFADVISWLGIRCIICKEYSDLGNIVVRLGVEPTDSVGGGGGGAAAPAAEAADTYVLHGHWSSVHYGPSSALGVQGVAAITCGKWPPLVANPVTMCWDTTFETVSSGGYVDLSSPGALETCDIKLGGEAPLLMAEQLHSCARGLFSQVISAPLFSSRVTRRSTEADQPIHVLLQGRGSNSIGRFAVFGVCNTATLVCIFWKQYFELSDDGSDSSTLHEPCVAGLGHAKPTFVSPAFSAAANMVPRPAAAAAAAATATAAAAASAGAGGARSVFRGAAGNARPSLPLSGAAGAGPAGHAGEKRVRVEADTDPDDVLAELAAELAEHEAKKAALTAKLVQAQQAKDAREALGRLDRANAYQGEAASVVRRAKAENTVAHAAAHSAQAAAKSASDAVQVAAALAKTATSAADTAALSAEAAKQRLVDSEAALKRAQEECSAAARCIAELPGGTLLAKPAG